ncbi:hypothetical protein [Aeromonas veronii]|uniref:hypothetical protein n=1 Tax=Aeromonas veronii TaxID=654 RepID=UPI002B4BC7A0|nr:hypothetical protein [Aeromonas veronii]
MAKLEARGIKTVADLVAADPKALRRCYGVVVERITQIGPMHQALAGYMERAAEKLRGGGDELPPCHPVHSHQPVQ